MAVDEKKLSYMPYTIMRHVTANIIMWHYGAPQSRSNAVVYIEHFNMDHFSLECFSDHIDSLNESDNSQLSNTCTEYNEYSSLVRNVDLLIHVNNLIIFMSINDGQ